MRISVLAALMVALLSAANAATAGAPEHKERKREEGYVKVEMKGILEASGRPFANSPTRPTELRINIPGLDDEGAALNSTDPGVYWELFLPDNQKLGALARKLNGKMVVVKGTVVLIGPRRRWPATYGAYALARVVIEVSSLHASPAKK